MPATLVFILCDNHIAHVEAGSVAEAPIAGDVVLFKNESVVVSTEFLNNPYIVSKRAITYGASFGPWGGDTTVLIELEIPTE